jgi:hypothetical protein
MEVAVLGHPLEPTPAPARSLGGTWALEDASNPGSLIRLSTDGASVSGCVVRGAQGVRLHGTLAGHVARVSLEASDRTRGNATLVVSADGTRLRGRYELGGMGSWSATRQDGPPGDCELLLAQLGLARRLDTTSERVVLAGVGFADDALLLAAGDDLSALVALLSARPRARLQLLVLGKSDGSADELRRTERRAQALVSWLLKRGIAPERYELGFGVLKWPTVLPEPRVEVRWKVD